MSPWARYQGCQAGQKVQWLEQTVRGAITKRAFAFVHDQPVAVKGQPLVRQRPPRPHVYIFGTAKAFEFVALSPTAALSENPS